MSHKLLQVIKYLMPMLSQKQWLLCVRMTFSMLGKGQVRIIQEMAQAHKALIFLD